MDLVKNGFPNSIRYGPFTAFSKTFGEFINILKFCEIFKDFLICFWIYLFSRMGERQRKKPKVKII